jgi:phosphomannomutase
MKVNSLNIAPAKIQLTREFQNRNRGAARKTSRILHRKVGPTRNRVQNSKLPHRNSRPNSLNFAPASISLHTKLAFEFPTPHSVLPTPVPLPYFLLSGLFIPSAEVPRYNVEMPNPSLNIESALPMLQAAQSAGQLSASAVENIRIWLTKPQYADYAPQIIQHIVNQQWRELEDAFWTIIPFGTAGRRGCMYPIGTNAINDRTMGESVQGLADYVRSARGNIGAKELRCAIAYDTRHRSRHFAELSAEIMVASGFEVLMFDGFRPTPELSFTVRDRKCDCGIMISASHNPPSDNAIKAFWSTGGQLRSPHDEGVIQCVARVTAIRRLPFAEALASGRVKVCQDEIDPRYQAAVLNQSQPGPRNIKILYSPLHGVGLTSVLPILQADGFQDIEVYQPHAKPDGDFPNVPGHVANPENPTVFNQMIEHSQGRGIEIILASDPDADRIGCAAPISISFLAAGGSSWSTLSGNQIGVLLGEFLLRRLKAAKRLTPEHYVIKTLVTSDMICRVAEGFSVRAYGDLLTGFKWIGSKIEEVGPEKFVFGFEEAHGYLAGTYARDKDGSVAAMLLAELAAECKTQGRTLHEQLDQLFLQYGCHLERTVNHTLPGADGLAKMKAVMARLRTNPPRQIGGLSVSEVRDYLQQQVLTKVEGGNQKADASHDWRMAEDRKLLGEVPRSDLLIFDLDPPGNRAAVRPSGTEPKLKFYLFAYEPPEKSKELVAVKQSLTRRLSAMESSLLQASEQLT